MKINVEFDLTPDEFRRSLGLPDVEAFQQDLLNRIHKQMESGVEGYDPMSLMQPFLQQQGLSQGLSQGMSQGLSQGLASFGTYQQMMLDMLRKASSGRAEQAESKEERAGAEKEKAEAKGKQTPEREPAEAKKSSKRAGTASARSRSRRSE
ncbi:hypothetical protein [Billgrantia montanilacus]|uniref:Uncharacterized protein n=1 Tax=Billgrantia montanilacus TaxID=2282305 RepID=A0A368U473_9GAMM|nr:hypothetical protein [Halomonas montanilacus]RCV91940.1 hypothetical protein DU505_02415 [Halomonas montanilacus]